MTFNVLKRKLDESIFCPLCQAAMFSIDALQFDEEMYFHECSNCSHRIFSDLKQICHCTACTRQRKKMIQETLAHEQQAKKIKNDVVINLQDLSLLHKLFLLALLDKRVQDNQPHDEYINWPSIKYESISPNYLFQSHLIKQIIQLGVLVKPHAQDEAEVFYLRLRLDGYNEPSLFSIVQQLRNWFYHNLSLGIPYKNTDEVQDVLFLILYQEIVQFMQHYCRTWGIQIAGNHQFQKFCYRLMQRLAVGQIYYLIQTALEYLYHQKALKPRNENYINTNILKKTLEQYRERALNEKWETSTLPRPLNLPLSQMSQIFIFRFLSYDENIFMQPIWRAWKKIEPRLNFFCSKRCMYCGSSDLEVDYDATHYVSLICLNCRHQDHYFTQ